MTSLKSYQNLAKEISGPLKYTSAKKVSFKKNY